MPDHVPRLCELCGSPLTATRRCTSCGARRPASGASTPPARDHERAYDPLQHAIETLTPWVRGERGLWAPRF